jgi:two-component system cell cycle response regulator DivK
VSDRCSGTVSQFWQQKRSNIDVNGSGRQAHKTAGTRSCKIRKIKMPKILLVEDNEMNRDMLSRRLERKGYSVLHACDGEQGHFLACSEAPDLILMDISLPLMNGWEVTRLLKGNKRTRHIPVIALTAHALVTDRNTALDAGCDDYETKPIDFASLDAKIESLLTVKK